MGAAPRIDFKQIAEAALSSAASLLSKWLPKGSKVGFEWKSCNPMRADNHEGSFSINMVTGAWGDFPTDDKGGDLISLYAYLNECDQLDAARAVAAEVGIAVPPPKGGRSRDPAPPNSAPSSEKSSPPAETAAGVKEAKPKTFWAPVMPVPEDAPPPPAAHEFRGKPERSWCYRDREGRVLGYVFRFVSSDGGKEIIPLTFCRHEKSGKLGWRWLGFPEPRPLYGLDRLAAKPGATVMVVEGEKCADAGDAELPDLVVVSWPGGSKAIDKVDWSPLAGCKVITWADCDAQREKFSKAERESGVDPESKPLLPVQKQPGVQAMARIRTILHGLDCKLWDMAIPAPLEKPSGWDIADAIADGLTGEQLAAYVRDKSRLWEPGAEPSETISTPKEAAAEEGGESWPRRLLRTDKGKIESCVANVFDILAQVDVWRDVVAFDEFSQRAVKLRPPPYFGGKAGEWESTDDTQAAMWMTRKWYFAPSSATVAEAIEALSKANSFHPVRNYLKGLPAWDGKKRLESWLPDYLGVPSSEYTKRVGTWFCMGMIARVMKPGCKFDYCLVLEGEQGKGKSTALRVLAGDEWFGDTDLDLHNKDSMIALQGKWVYEIAELGAIARSESLRQKSFLSRQVDEFRPPYGRRDIKCPRQLVFAGTTNEWEWNKDPTGGRRFWPVMCGVLDIEGLRAAREQMLAEALAYYEAGNRYHPNPEEQRRYFDPEQLQREQSESLVDGLHDWVFSQVMPFSLATAMQDGLKLDASKWTRDMQTRVGTALRKLGCGRIEKRNGTVRFLYKPPEKAASSTPDTSAQQPEGGIRAPF